MSTAVDRRRYSNGMRRFTRPAWWTHRAELTALWGAFIAVHLYYGWQAIWHPARPFNDVTIVYRMWMDQALAGDIPGIHADYVYPVVSLLPMWVADIFGGNEHYGVAWLGLVLALDAVALWWLTRNPGRTSAGPRRMAAWFWTVFLALLGTIAFGRIDAITVPIAIIALGSVMERSAVAGALMTFGAWLKVWPAALFAAAFVAIHRRWSLVVGAASVCLAVGVVVLAIGGFDAVPHLVSFVTEQTGRGLQLESTAASAFLVLVAFGANGYHIEFDREILTQQIAGPGTEFVGNLLTPLMFVTMLALMVLAVVAKKRGVGIAYILPTLALGIVAAFIVVNKVGSPQFITWLAPVVIFGLLWNGRHFLPVAIVSLSISLLTQLVYPWYYWQITNALPAGTLALVLRNGFVLLLLVWSMWRLGKMAVRARRRTARVAEPVAA